MIDLLTLTAWKPIMGYFIPTGLGITFIVHLESVCGEMVSVIGNGHGNMSSNPWWDCSHFI